MKPLRVLVVEDDALLGIMLGEVLEELGFEIAAIEATEADAVSAATRCKPDLMIVDVRLHLGSGISAVDKICQAGFIPHVFVTGDMAEVRARRPGAFAIHKPFMEADLALAIQKAVAAAGWDAGGITASPR